MGTWKSIVMGDLTHALSRVDGSKSTTAANMHSEEPGNALIFQTRALSAGSNFARPRPTVMRALAAVVGTGIFMTTFCPFLSSGKSAVT
jgi:hypothetical protein